MLLNTPKIETLVVEHRPSSRDLSINDPFACVSIGSHQVSILAKQILACIYLELYESVNKTNLASSTK
jgi:hypothetical protein